MAELPTGTVTFLFTDIEGSTALLKTLRDEYATVLSDHQELLRSAFESAGGQEIDTQGDAFFIVFHRAKDAVLAAASAQRSLAGHAWPQGSTVRVRMGIHSGEPTLGGDRYVGLGVHRAARICGAAHGGQVLLSNATRELIEDDLPPELSLRDLGEQRLKDIDRPERIVQLVVPGLPDQFPPLRSPAEPAFEGREGELAAAAEATVRPKLRLAGRPRRLIVPVGVLLAAALVAGVLALSGLIGGASGTIVSPHSLGVIDPATNKVVDTIELPNRATGLALGAGSLWIADGLDGTLLRVDSNRRRVVKTIGIGFSPDAVAVGKGTVWVVEHAGIDNFASIREIDPLTDQGGRPKKLQIAGPKVTGFAADDQAAWLALRFSGVYRIDQGTGHPLGPIPGSSDATSLAIGSGAVWIAEHDDEVISRIDPATNSVQLSIPFGAREADSMAFGAGALWVADAASDKVWRIDPVRNEISDTISVGRAPASIAVGAGSVWVANRGDGTVSRIDPKQGKVVSTIKVGKTVDGVVAGQGAVWVSVP
jgi:class 3 adenylate cyclase/DNA-binding beta-propeller fold protein YncE